MSASAELNAVLEWAAESGVPASLCIGTLIVVYSWSGIAKTVAPGPMARAAAELGLLKRESRTLARCLGLLEASLASALLAAQIAWSANALQPLLLVAAFLALAFTFIVASALRRGLRVSCGCFGAQGAELGRGHIYRSVALALAAVLPLCLLNYRPDSAPGGALSVFPPLVAAAASVVGGSVVLQARTLINNTASSRSAAME